ncbi:MAG: hypothetical protein K2F71_05235 [Paramuribaculum sp.]|nr:hypothetical protein [Paramuribaculum sp.]
MKMFHFATIRNEALQRFKGMDLNEKICVVLRHIPRWVAPGLTLAAVLWLTLAPRPLPDSDVRLFEHADKVVHALMFGFLSWIFTADMSVGRRGEPAAFASSGWIRVALPAVGAALLGGVIELLQPGLSGRSCDAADFAADVAGVLLALPFSVSISRR